ncbi:alpha/beta hydrolase [Neobacillus dielmonensis]|uniref:alpha/beta hydrolase n=1 Tax=Neobacillus dielmonensis TaxID=1347369 RepID=UPI0005A76A77|nr:alpha/beta hydrolase [Neobacillus dielmonensis]
MATVSEFTFQTMDGIDIFAKKWMNKDVGTPKAIVQIAHGMAEHIARYDTFARNLVTENVFVYGNDHRGHGETGKKANSIGYFADEQGFEKVVEDMRNLTTIIEKEYPDIPIYLFGHSMGSFLSRRYIQRFGGLLSGTILCGTSGNPGIMGKIGKVIAARESKKKGSKTPSPFLNNLTFGSYNKAFQPNRTEFDWLTRDEKEVDQYIADPLCGGIFTAGFFYDLLDGLLTTNMPQNIGVIPTNLPIFLISGDQDPVGGKKGKGVIQTMQQFKNAGLQDVSIKLYPEARHELLNEINKNEVQNDIIEWINAHL